eukprot:gene40064-48820_t
MDNNEFTLLQESLISGWNDQSFVDYTYLEAALSLKRSVEHTLKTLTSQAILCYGSGYDAAKIVHPVLNTIDKKNKNSISALARVDGALFDSDDDAIISIADQLILSRAQARQHQAALEDLEQFLRGCYVEHRPAILYVENFQVFAGRKRQTFIYTLLDLLHTQQAYFMVILQSSSVDILHKLEKRVVSRLSAITVFPPPLTAEAMCAEMFVQLTRKLDGSFQQFRESVHECFGVFDCTPELADFSDWAGFKLVLRRKGRLHDTLKRYIAAGCSRRDFRTALSVCVGRLTASDPNITAHSYLSALESQQPPSLADMLHSLCPLELWVYTGIAHVYMQRDVKAQLDRPILLDEALVAFDRMTELLSKKGLAMQRIASVLQHLAQQGLVVILTGPKGPVLPAVAIPTSVDTEHFVVIPHSPEEVRGSYMLNAERPAHYCWQTVRPAPDLRMPERLRRSVLQPLEPLLYGQADARNSISLDTALVVNL